jgi:hypothetical protein
VKGADLKKIHEAVVSSFNPDDFAMLLRFDFDLDMEDEVGNVGFKKAVMVFLKKAEDEGWLPELIAVVARERPRRSDVQAVYREFASALVSEFRREEVDAKVQEAYARFFGQRPPVDIQAGGKGEAVVPATDAGLERTLRDDLGYLDVAQWAATLVRLEGRVCRIELNDDRATMGTGFLVGPDAVLTNFHVLEQVIEEAHPAGAVRFRFDYRTQPDGTPADGTLAELAAPDDPANWLLGHARYSAAEKKATPDAAPPAADELDYALVRLSRKIGDEPPAPGGPARGWIEVPAAQPAMAGIPALMILQHPNRAPLKLAFDTRPNVELKHGGLRVRYATNTEGGSSGSPCFDKDWKLIALHHYGDPAFDQPRYNQGIPIGKIRDHLRDQARAALGGRAV